MFRVVLRPGMPKDGKVREETICRPQRPSGFKRHWVKANRAAEFLCTLYVKKPGQCDDRPLSAFSFGQLYAAEYSLRIGNFIQSALENRPHHSGRRFPDALPTFMQNLAIWLGPVAQEQVPPDLRQSWVRTVFSILDLAQIVAECFKPNGDIKFWGIPIRHRQSCS